MNMNNVTYLTLVKVQHDCNILISIEHQSKMLRNMSCITF